MHLPSVAASESMNVCGAPAVNVRSRRERGLGPESGSPRRSCTRRACTWSRRGSAPTRRTVQMLQPRLERSVGDEDDVAQLAVGQRPLADVAHAVAERAEDGLVVELPRQLVEERRVGAQHEIGHVGDEQVRVVERRLHERRVRRDVEERPERPGRPGPARRASTRSRACFAPALGSKSRSWPECVLKKTDLAARLDGPNLVGVRDAEVLATGC